MENGWIDGATLDVEQNVQIIRLLDATVIKLEGGTDFDLKALDEEFVPEKPKVPEQSIFTVEVEKPPQVKTDAEETESSEPAPIKAEEGEESFVESDAAVNSIPKDEDENSQEKLLGIKQEQPDTNGASEIKAENPDPEPMEKGEEDAKESETKNGTDEVEVAEEAAENRPRHLHRTASIFLRNLAPTVARKEVEDVSLHTGKCCVFI